MRPIRTLGVVLCAAATLTPAWAVPAAAHATPASGISVVVLSKQTVNGKDYIVDEVTIAPNGSTGWHTHQGVIYGVIRSGTLTHYAPDCHQDGIYRAGDAITDPTGPDHVHLARNLDTVPLVLDVTYEDPAGAPTADSAANPGCDFA